MEILQTIQTAEISLTITVDNVDLFDSQDVYAEFFRYWSFTFIDTIQPTAGHATVYNDFVTAWRRFIVLHGADLAKAVQAAASVYNPLHNYDMQETGANGERRGQTTTTTTPHGKITNTAEQSGTLSDTVTQYASGLDSTENGVQTDKTVTIRTPTNYKTTTETSYAAGTDSETVTTHLNDQSATAAGTTISGADVATEHVLQRSGNIGVTTSQQMLQSEIELRMNLNLLQDFVRRFIQRYCICAGVYS